MSDYEPKCKKTLPIIFDDRMPGSNLTPKLVGRVNNNTEDLKNLYEDEITHLKQDISELETGKADASGTSENLTAGNAEQLMTDKGVTDEVPYLLRASSGNGADREEDKIVGGTVAWNQMIKNGNFENINDWTAVNGSLSVSNNVATITPTYQSGQYAQLYGGSQGVVVIPRHKILTTIELKSNAWAQTGNAVVVSIAELWITNLTANALSATNWNRISVIKQLPDSTSYVNADVRKYYESSMADFQVRNFSVFDLTAMFGTAIADRAYAMELSTAGSGIAWLKSMGFFTADYYPYDAGTLKSVEGLTAHSMVGFNQWDEEWEVGTINNSTGANESSSQRIRSKNYIPVIPGTTYYVKVPISDGCFAMYDANKSIIQVIPFNNQAYAIPSNCHYVRFSPATAYGTTYNNDICINLSWDGSRNGEYEPYLKHSYPLDSDLTLRGIPKLDSNNQVYYDGDEYASDGTVKRNFKTKVLNGGSSESWLLHTGSGVNQFYVWVNDVVYVANSVNVVSDRYSSIPIEQRANNYGTCYTGEGAICFNISSSVASTVEAWLALIASNPITVVYRTTPTTEEADPYQNPQILDPYGTEAYETTGIVPVGHETFYPENLRAKIEGLPFNFATLIAPTESTYKATRAYSANNLFIVDNILYKATTSIASGGTITPGTNCTATTLAEIIAALS